MGVRLLWILAIVAMTIADRQPRAQCPQLCLCSRSIDGDFETVCMRNGSQILRVDIKFGKFLRVDCTSQPSQSTDYEMLEGLDVGPVDKVRFQFCPATEFVDKLTEQLNVSGVKSLFVGQTNFTDTLGKRYLNKFSSITQLNMQYSGITKLPDDFLEDLSNLTNLNLLGNELKSLPAGIFQSVHKLLFLELGRNKINHLEPGVFKDLSKLKYLNLWGNSLNSITERTVFSGLISLESLDLLNSGLTLLTPDVFANLLNLKHISLSRNNFTSLPKGLFSQTPLLVEFKLFENNRRLSLPSGFLANLTKLQNVSLNGNYMSTVPGDLFQGSSSILFIRLEDNLLTELPEDLFKDTRELQKLDIDSNLLKTLPSGVFSTLSKLKILNLAKNHLTIIPEALFKGLSNLEELNLERNALSYIHPKAFPSVENESCLLKRMYLAHNNLTFKEDKNIITDAFGSQSTLNACTKLEELYLAHNTLTEIMTDWRQVMIHLAKLDLSNNNLTTIASEDLQFLSEKLELNLSNNKITVIDMTYIEFLSKSFKSSGQSPRDVRVLLKGNPIRCDCRAYNLLRYMEGGYSDTVYNFVYLITENLTCSSPPEVSGVLVSQIKSRVVTCDLTGNKCPKPCACRGRTDDGAIIIDCSNLGLLRAPEILPWESGWNYTEVHLEKNRLKALPSLLMPGYDKVTKIYASHNNISRLDLENLSYKIKVLELNGNNLSHVSRRAIDFLLTNDSQLERIRLDNNPWQCDCETRNLLHFLRVFFKKVDHFPNITCTNGNFLSQLSADDLCPVSNTLMIALSTSVAAIGIILGALAAFYYRYQREVKVWLYAKHLCLWFVTEQELDKEKLYDAFISYSHKDEDFVVNHLVPGLENGPTPFKLCLHFRDWIAGEWITSQIARSVEDSRRTIVVLSPNFLDSVWGRMEFRTAHKQALSEGRARLILLLYGELGPLDSLDPELKAYLSTNTYVKWGDPWFWNKLRYALPHPSRVINKTDIICMPQSHQFNDKCDLMEPTTPSATTPPADTIINPMTQGHAPLSIMNGHTKLFLETNDHVNGCVKSV